MNETPIFTRAIIKREIRRARLTGQAVNRMYLHRETGLPWYRLEKEISWAATEIDTESPPTFRTRPSRRRGGDAAGQSKTEHPRDSATARAAPPTTRSR